MIYLPPVIELGHLTVVDSGVPNQERIVVRPTDTVNLGNCGLLLGLRNTQTGGTVPIPNFFFWFGDIEIKPPSWIVVFTGKGEAKQVQDEHTKAPIYVFYWGFESVLFTTREIIPFVCRFGGLTFGNHMKALPSIEEYIKATEQNQKPKF